MSCLVDIKILKIYNFDEKSPRIKTDVLALYVNCIGRNSKG